MCSTSAVPTAVGTHAIAEVIGLEVADEHLAVQCCRHSHQHKAPSEPSPLVVQLCARVPCVFAVAQLCDSSCMAGVCVGWLRCVVDQSCMYYMY
jgi:hypothetical protein